MILSSLAKLNKILGQFSLKIDFVARPDLDALQHLRVGTAQYERANNIYVLQIGEEFICICRCEVVRALNR